MAAVQFVAYARGMRRKLITLICIAALAACGPRIVQISNDKCWSVKPGDRISGAVKIVGIVDNTLVEGGAHIQNTACPGKTMGLAIPSGPLLDGYRKTMKTSPTRFVERRFILNGEVYQNPGSERLLVRVTDLRPYS